MPLPSSDCPSDVPADTCCDTFSAMADRLRTVAKDGLVECLEASCADREFRTYVTHGRRVPEPLGDSLVVHMLDTTQTVRSSNAAGRLLGVAVHIAQFRVLLMETGWPTIETYPETGQIVIPDAELVNGVALHSLAHGERMYREIVNTVQTRTLYPPTLNPHIGEITVGQLVPEGPDAYLAGWSMTVSVEVTL